jgi:small redox-active disulfide protein 2
VQIAILGTGCARCRQTTDIVRQAVEQTGVSATIQKVEDIREIVKYQVMTTPAVAIDGQVKISGKVPTVDEVKSLLAQASQDRPGGVGEDHERML